MDREEEEATAADRWQGSLNATCNRLCNQYLTMLKAASGMSTANTISSSGLRHGSSSGAGNSGGLVGGRRGGGTMRDINEPSPALAANAALSALQTKLAAQNLEVASSHLLDLIRTLRLSALLMDEAVIAEEEREEYNIAIESAETAAEESAILEAEILKLRGQDICENS